VTTGKGENEQRLKLAGAFLARNEQLVKLLSANLQRVEFNQWNWKETGSTLGRAK
jgi:hypothetical protein